MAASVTAPASAQEFTSRALPPEGLLQMLGGIQPAPQPVMGDGVFVVRKGMDALSASQANPRTPVAKAPTRKPPETVSGDSEVRCVAQAVYHEARGESMLAQQAVADVVMNRVRSGRWSSSACGVVHAPGQFQNASRWTSPRAGDPLWDRAIGIARSAIAGTVAVSSRLMSFHVGRAAPRGGMRIGNQVFF